MNFRLHKADDILPFVIYFTVYVTVGDGPASPELLHFSWREIHKRTCLLVVDPLIHALRASSACLMYSSGDGFQGLVHFHECLGLDTHKFHKSFLFSI